MSSHLLEQVLLVVAGAVVPALFAWLRGWKRDLRAEGARALAMANETKERGKLEQRVDLLEKDIAGVADMARKRFARLEKKDTALETYVTGKMPRVSGESEPVK